MTALAPPLHDELIGVSPAPRSLARLGAGPTAWAGVIFSVAILVAVAWHLGDERLSQDSRSSAGQPGLLAGLRRLLPDTAASRLGHLPPPVEPAGRRPGAAVEKSGSATSCCWAIRARCISTRGPDRICG